MFEDDVAVGLRLTPNDVMESTLLLVYVGDVETDEGSLLLEGATRLGEHWRVVLEGAALGGARVNGLVRLKGRSDGVRATRSM